MCFSCYSTSMPIFPLLPLFCIILLSLNSNCAKVLYSVNRNPTYDPTCMTSWVVNVSFRSIVWALYAALLYCLLLSAIVYNNSEKNKWLMVEWAFTIQASYLVQDCNQLCNLSLTILFHYLFYGDQIKGMPDANALFLVNPQKTAELKLANLSSRKYFPVTVACILFSHLNATLKYFLNYATLQNIIFHIPELKDTSPF